ncbi:hypothetical protein DERF_011046 [Dermatophagoides farinae]|uniref:Uncharacterized protein n=1 Tax=Dermatophagoides farinae TaxID=6954 RepID=A0A922L2Q7_DERFA|nr:hypothetical protein DERF_011046 [Dermatophagoides farinae]
MNRNLFPHSQSVLSAWVRLRMAMTVRISFRKMEKTNFQTPTSRKPSFDGFRTTFFPMKMKREDNKKLFNTDNVFIDVVRSVTIGYESFSNHNF